MILEKVVLYKKKMLPKKQEESAQARFELKENKKNQVELESKIRDLEKKRLAYPKKVTVLQKQIEEELHRIGRSGKTYILCDLLEVINPDWQDAVEGYLDEQRFYLLVSPEDFDVATSIYDKMRPNKEVCGAGLINAVGLEAYDEAPKNSLASVVDAKNTWARRYINMILGSVQLCENYQELKNYDAAITKQCMKYQDHVVTAILPETYETPYIGALAYQKQLEQCKQMLRKQEEISRNLQEKLEDTERVSKYLEYDFDLRLNSKLPKLKEMRNCEKMLADCRSLIKDLEANDNIIKKSIQLSEMKKEQRQLEEVISQKDRDLGAIELDEKQQEERLGTLPDMLSNNKTCLVEVIEKLGAEEVNCANEYDNQKEKKGRDLLKFKEDSARYRKRNQTMQEKVLDEMVHLMREYKIAHDFGAPDSMDGYPQFLAEYDKLNTSDLLSYEDQVQQARIAAEQEFQEQFLSRLQENIKQAQGEFKELNRSLEEIHFSKEQYRFQYTPSKRHKKFYDMIMDDFNIMQGKSLFSGIFRENHREVIDELFTKLTTDDENSSKILEEYTDYRTYMDYDIKITMDDGRYMLYSKVSREKSGGETQTPFYITLAASFIQLYRNGIGGSIGLVMFDEAFNNMDDERIAGVLEFITNPKLNLQVLIAAPPEKIQYIQPLVKSTLFIEYDGVTNYADEYTMPSKLGLRA